MSKLSSNPRKKRQGVPSIDLDELYNAPNNRGMCSFLERPPEEARLRREQRLSVDKEDMARAGSTVPFPVDQPEAPAIPQGNRATATSKLPATGDMQAAGDIHGPGILPLVGGRDGPETKSDTSEFEISTKVDEARSGLEPVSATLERIAKTRGVSRGDGISQVDGISPVAGSLSDTTPSTLMPAPGNIPAHGDLAGDPQNTSSSYADYLVTPLLPDSKLPAAIDMQDAPVPGVPASLIPPPGIMPVAAIGHFDNRALPADPKTSQPPGPGLTDTAPAPSQPDRSFLRAVRTKLPRVYIQPDARTPSKLPPPGTLIGELVSPGGRITKIQRCVLAQDGHSNGEQVLYVALWNEAKPERDDLRIITMGMGALSRLARMDISNVRKNIRSLVEKLSIEIIADEISDVQQGKTYRIFSYRRILENRRQAGLEWIIKSKGVTFIDPTQYGIAIPTGDIPGARTLPALSELPPPAASHIQAGTPSNPPPASSSKPPAPPAGISQRPYRKELSNHPKQPNQKPSSTEIPPDLPPKLRQLLPSFDDAAVRTLVTRCRQHDPDSSSDEIEYCFQVKANQLLRRGKQVTNAVGLMLWAVPKCFEGSHPLHLAFREQQRAERDRQAKADQEWKQQLAEYRRLAQDPNTSEEDRKWYLTMLNDGI
jgi:hypothetical protein